MPTASERIRAAREAEARQLLEEATAVLVTACDTDDELWSVRACGQDTEEAETSGYLMGYRDALSAVNELLYHGKPDILAAWIDQARADTAEADAEITASVEAFHA